MQSQHAWDLLFCIHSPQEMELKGIWSVVLCACALSVGFAFGAEEDSVTLSESNSGKIDDRGRLIRDLLKDYDRRNYPSNITAKFSVSLIKFKVDEAEDNNAILVDALLKQTWTDSRLSFDPEEYGGISVLRLPASEVWKPDIMLYNSDSGPDGMRCVDTNVLVYPNGLVLQVPSCTLRAHCNLTLVSAPLGEQLCNLKFGSWTMDGFTVNTEIYNPEDDPLADYHKSPRWDITSVKATRNEKFYPCCKEPYIDINYDISFHRRQA